MGQVTIVLAAVPLLRKLRAVTALPLVLSACVSALGAFWLAQRLAG